MSSINLRTGRGVQFVTRDSTRIFNSNINISGGGGGGGGLPPATLFGEYIYYDDTVNTYVVGGSQNIKLGLDAGKIDQASHCVAIGEYAGNQTQQKGAIAIGYSSGMYNQGLSSISRRIGFTI